MQASELYFDLLKDWCDALASVQMPEVGYKEVSGAIVCPACRRVHGRSADAILPMMYMAKRTGKEKYLRCARGLFRWSDSMYREGGYYINDVDNDWSGITVFFSTQLGEALRWFPDLLAEEEKQVWQSRFFETARYVREKIDKIGATINYPAAGAYHMAFAGTMSEGAEQQAYFARAKELAKFVCGHILPNGLLFGEGHPCDILTAKGARAIDIGYNMEETIPALLEYSHLMRDEETKTLAIRALKTHLKFFLPDGGMDNSFGSRAFKWSYWGSRTSDGFQAAAALLRREYPEFHRIAVQNALLLRECTYDGLLYGGPMFREAGEAACVHHTFCHGKALAKALLILGSDDDGAALPIERFPEDTVEYFPELCTYLVSSGRFRATLTDYDYEYCPASHGTGGALTLLWHEKAGPVCVGTMNRYYVVEPNNMQIMLTREDICLTPRIEYTENGTPCRNIQDLSAVFARIADTNSFLASGKLVNEKQEGDETFRIRYDIGAEAVEFTLESSVDAEYILPVVAKKDDKVIRVSDNRVAIQRKNITIQITTDGAVTEQSPETRIFNPVGGFLAYPVRIPLTVGVQTKVRLEIAP